MGKITIEDTDGTRVYYGTVTELRLTYDTIASTNFETGKSTVVRTGNGSLAVSMDFAVGAGDGEKP
jgi:hypothetical protein